MELANGAPCVNDDVVTFLQWQNGADYERIGAFWGYPLSLEMAIEEYEWEWNFEQQQAAQHPDIIASSGLFRWKQEWFPIVQADASKVAISYGPSGEGNVHMVHKVTEDADIPVNHSLKSLVDEWIHELESGNWVINEYQEWDFAAGS